MNQLRIGATLTLPLIGLCFAGSALAGSGGEHKERHGGRGGAALAAHFFERLDANNDGQLTRAEAEAEGQRLFDRMDADKDGALIREEAEVGARAVAQEELVARFKALDTNGDGRVTVDESKLPARFFARLDTNQDKAVTREELAAVSHFGAGKSNFMFAKADANKDGKVTRAEGTQAALARFDLADENRDGAITRAELEARMGKRGERQKRQGGQGPSEKGTNG